MIGGPMDGPRALALNEHLMETLRDSGLEAGEAARASYLLIVYVFGSIALETAGLSDGLSGFSEAERIASRLEGFSAIPAAGYPLSAGAAAIMATYVSTQQYRWGLHKVLDGLTRT
jgi:TetR/AcrR family tetracycline transcriptional repressor